ncbi:MAG: hypothetical protein KGL18_03000 [Burkholderiales bacterium]|nr:hypothetical protein [Burkholderiales bacterium]MDE2157362.1 hypothetical protein [Burkholderiales bacterium]MDE2501934.1 hypothetical protein [Burkholderiales bacterium]
MKLRDPSLILVAALWAPLAWAADGLQLPGAGAAWPQWQARIALQSADISPLTLSRIYETGAPRRTLRGGSMFGDYYFGSLLGGGFRASGGLLVGQQSGLPLARMLAGSRLDVAVNGSVAPLFQPQPGGLSTATYLGLGYSTSPLHSSLALTADLGLVAEHPLAAGGVGRALFGNQAMDNALHDMRLSPMLQLGLRYAF